MKYATQAIAIAIGAMIAVPALAAKPAGSPGATVTTSLGCDALDPGGVVFTDPAAILRTVVTPSGNVNTVCNGHLLPETPPPAVPVEFTEKSGTGFVCLSRFEETIDVDGTFTLTCHFKEHGKI